MFSPQQCSSKTVIIGSGNAVSRHSEIDMKRITALGAEYARRIISVSTVQSLNIRTIKKLRKKRLFQLSIPGMMAVSHSPSALSSNVAPMMK